MNIPSEIKHLQWNDSSFKGKDGKIVSYKTATALEAIRDGDKYAGASISIDVYYKTIRLNKSLTSYGETRYLLLWKGTHDEFSKLFEQVKNTTNLWMKRNAPENSTYKYYGWSNPPIIEGVSPAAPYLDEYHAKNEYDFQHGRYDDDDDDNWDDDLAYPDNDDEFGDYHDFLDY